MNEITQFIILFFAGIGASFINVMAGGGSLITISAMLLLGIEATVANATNRLGILTGAGSASLGFAKEKKLDFRSSFFFGLCAVPGAITGAIFASKIENRVFELALGIVMIAVTISLFLPKKENRSAKHSVWIYPALFVVGFYGGFIQAGVGIILMATFRHLHKLSLVEVNAQKVAITLLFTIPALIVFAVTDKILWIPAIALALGNWVGAKAAVKIAVKKGDIAVKIVLAIVIVLMAIRLFM